MSHIDSTINDLVIKRRTIRVNHRSLRNDLCSEQTELSGTDGARESRESREAPWSEPEHDRKLDAMPFKIKAQKFSFETGLFLIFDKQAQLEVHFLAFSRTFSRIARSSSVDGVCSVVMVMELLTLLYMFQFKRTMWCGRKL